MNRIGPPSRPIMAFSVLAIVVCAPSAANSACQWDYRFKPPAWVCDDPNPPKEPKGSSDSVLVPEQSTGPSPFGSSQGSQAEHDQKPASNIDPNLPPPGKLKGHRRRGQFQSCGEGMTLGKDGQCYPVLH